MDDDGRIHDMREFVFTGLMSEDEKAMDQIILCWAIWKHISADCLEITEEIYDKIENDYFMMLRRREKSCIFVSRDVCLT